MESHILRELGLCFVCAHCEHAWEGFQQRLGQCVIRYRGMKCDGPGGNDSFPHYKGPLGGDIVSFCFVCGGDTDFLVDAPGRKLALCRKHYNNPVWKGVRDGQKRENATGLGQA